MSAFIFVASNCVDILLHVNFIMGGLSCVVISPSKMLVKILLSCVQLVLKFGLVHFICCRQITVLS
jgi:hypothetical protein